MKEISEVPRTAQIFIDNYSLRDDETNRNIIDLNRILKKNNMGKTVINKKIDNFLLHLEERKRNHLMDLEKITEIKVEDEEFKEIMKRNLQNEAKTQEQDDSILIKKKIISKVPIDMSNQTVTENFNIFKQFKDKILDKKQEEIYRLKPMTAGEFLNENSKKK